MSRVVAVVVRVRAMTVRRGASRGAREGGARDAHGAAVRGGEMKEEDARGERGRGRRASDATSMMNSTTSTRTTVLGPTMRVPSPASVLANVPRAVDDANDAHDARDARTAPTADAGAVCRICLDARDVARQSPHTIDAHALITLGCACRGDVALAHKSCASRWFAPLARGCARGAALSPDWTLVWRVTCEVCGVDVSPELTHDVVKACKRALRMASSSSVYASSSYSS